MTHPMPPIPPASRTDKGRPSDSKKDATQDASAPHEHHANFAEKGETANIKQNTTNKGFLQGRRVK